MAETAGKTRSARSGKGAGKSAAGGKRKTPVAAAQAEKAALAKAVRKPVKKKAAKKSEIVSQAPREISPVEANSASGKRVRAVSREEVARLAYDYWLERGCQHGHNEEDWLRAERELRRRVS